MNFRLEITADFVCDERKVKYEKLGFEFVPNDWHYNKREQPWVKKSQPAPVLEISTIEELMAFVQEHGEIILGKDSIEIYDGYRE